MNNCSKHTLLVIKSGKIGAVKVHKYESTLWFVQGIVHLQWLVDFPVLGKERKTKHEN